MVAKKLAGAEDLEREFLFFLADKHRPQPETRQGTQRGKGRLRTGGRMAG